MHMSVISAVCDKPREEPYQVDNHVRTEGAKVKLRHVLATCTCSDLMHLSYLCEQQHPCPSSSSMQFAEGLQHNYSVLGSRHRLWVPVHTCNYTMLHDNVSAA